MVVQSSVVLPREIRATFDYTHSPVIVVFLPYLWKVEQHLGFLTEYRKQVAFFRKYIMW